MNFYQFIISRLNGEDIEKDFDYHLGLVKKGIAGFIIFGGKLLPVREGLIELQKEAKRTLIIASDLEQGLGQQIEGGTTFPPAMAIASALAFISPAPFKGEGEGGGAEVTRGKLKLLKNTFQAIALEARYAGINTVFAPVLDINTNPQNPIISTRAFGNDPESVSFLGCEMIKILQSFGIAACGKHFPGHGDTETDSHISLPLINKNLESLEKIELVPFRDAIRAGLKMIMLGHLSVPAMDPSGIPASISAETIRYLREKMEFRGIAITDALSMHGLTQIVQTHENVIARGEAANQSYPRQIALPLARNDRIGIEEQASLIALKAGVDLLLHPTDAGSIVSYLEGTGYYPDNSAIKRLEVFRETLCKSESVEPYLSFEENKKLSEKLARKAINIKGKIKPVKNPFLLILNDDERGKGDVLIEVLKSRYSSLEYRLHNRETQISDFNDIKRDREIILAVFSSIKAWKGGLSPLLKKTIEEFEERARVFISFGSPYIFDNIKRDCVKIFAYWDSEAAQRAVAELI
ncbi:MAG: glycoside hydrolase family 3 N-terminal domain-containing protein [Nitrospirota bacterium]